MASRPIISVVVDDIRCDLARIRELIISNTPKQILLRALEPTPFFAHVPLILGPDKRG
jgi:hypothetical protein